eukprot:scaffold2188_cov102-Isochrysis_galbana.AAC.5
MLPPPTPPSAGHRPRLPPPTCPGQFTNCDDEGALPELMLNSPQVKQLRTMPPSAGQQASDAGDK